jgi:nucleotide-binding universal stress UspA family protein
MNMTVVVGVDYSEAAKAALRLAAQEARWRQAPLIAVSAYEPPIGPVGGFPGSAMHTEGEQRAAAEAELRATVDEELGDQAAQTQLRVSEGLAGRVIVETAHQTHAQLVVLAARTGMAVVPGTVSQYVLLKSRCPVTIVPYDDKDEHTDDSHS